VLAVKTITIDLEAYEAFARRKREGEPFSQVIKTHLGRRRTGRDLERILEQVKLDDASLDRIDDVVRGRRRNRATAPKL
jgi:predicted CopG family antitoxin